MRLSRPFTHTLALAGSLLALTACNSEIERGEGTGVVATALDAQCTELSAGLIDHGCFHAVFGPFVATTASATVDYAATTPNINTVHTHYTVTLPAGSPGDHSGTIKYRPARTGDWAILMTAGTSLEVLDPSSNARPMLLEHAVPSCDGLPLARVYELTANVTYRLRFHSSATPSVAMVLEKLSDFEAAFFADADGDGFGDTNSLYATSCTAPPGHVADDTDCDDTAASVNPGAAELCDEVDNDCDGEVDEGALNACGGCGDVGSEICDSADNDCDGSTDEGVTNACGGCGAVPAEACDGADNDCDGTIDEGVTNACGGCGAVPAEACDEADNDCDGTIDEGVTNACGGCGEVGSEVCDNIDNDCDGSIDEGVLNACGTCGEVLAETCDGADNDCDGTTDEGVLNVCGGCGEVGSEVCDNIDNDCDGSTDEGVLNACGTCGEVSAETCNGVDDDCDGSIDEDATLTTYYADADGDGYGDPAVTVQACIEPTGYITDGTDCDDTDAAISPEAEEACNGVDDDCNGSADDVEDPLEHLAEHSCAHAQLGPFSSVSAAPVGTDGPDVSSRHRAYTIDLPAQGGSSHGGEVSLKVLQDGEYGILLGTDIALQVIDESGEAVVAEEDVASTFCPELVRIRLYDLEPGDYRLVFGPDSESVTLMVIEPAGAHDHEEEEGGEHFFRDADGDGFGDAADALFACAAPEGYVADDTDCNDGAATVSPGAEEICDEVDNDCDDEIDTVEGESVCECSDIVLTASRSYWPTAGSQPAVIELDHVASIRLPKEIPLVQGVAGPLKYAVLRFRDLSTSTPRTRDCLYYGSGSRYRFLYCQGGYKANEIVDTDRLKLEVDGGFGLVPTVATLTLEDYSCTP